MYLISIFYGVIVEAFMGITAVCRKPVVIAYTNTRTLLWRAETPQPNVEPSFHREVSLLSLHERLVNTVSPAS